MKYTPPTSEPSAKMAKRTIPGNAERTRCGSTEILPQENRYETYRDIYRHFPQ